MYSGTPLYGHPLNTDTRILRTVSFVSTQKSSYIFSKINPVNTDTLACPLGVRINRVPLLQMTFQVICNITLLLVFIIMSREWEISPEIITGLLSLGESLDIFLLWLQKCFLF